MTAPSDQTSLIPPPLEGDDDDVAWALQTAAVQWKRGARADAVVWLRRAVESALELGQQQRAYEIDQTIAVVEEQIVASVFSRPPTERPPTGSAEIDALIGLPPDPGRGSIDVEFDEQIDFDDMDDEETDVVSMPQIPDQPPSRPRGRRVRPPPPPSAMPRPPSELPLVAPPPSDALPDDIAPASEPTFMTGDRQAPSELPPSFPPPAPQQLEEETTISQHVDDLPAEPSVAPDAEMQSEYPASEGLPEVVDELAGLSEFPQPTAPAEDAVPHPAPATAAEAPGSEPPERFRSEAPTQVESEIPEAPAEPEVPTQVQFEVPEAPAESERVEPETPAEPEGPSIRAVSLLDVAGLQDLPEEAQLELVRTARLETLDVDDEVGAFGIALVVEGWVSVMPAIADAACAFAQPGDVVFTQGTLATSVALRVVAGETDTVVAVWDPDALERATADCPWVADDLRVVADRFQALAGAAMGSLGDRLDDTLRQSVTDRCEVRTLEAGDTVVEEGDPVPGIFVVGAGEIEVLAPSGEVVGELGPGDFLFASEVMTAGAAPNTARAGASGALLLFADRHTAHELMVSVPPLLEILAS